MTMLSVGDLARVFTLRRQTTELKSALERFAVETTSGRTADLARAVRGDFSPVAGLERALTVLDGYRTATNEASAFAAALQETLETVGSLASDGANGLLQSSMSSNPHLIISAGLDIKGRFASAVAALNTRVADRTLLAGAATNGPALAPPEDILAALRVATAGLTSAASFTAAVSAWFDDPAGFAAVAYLGSAIPLAPFQIAEGEDVQLTATANDPILRDMLEGLALGAMVGEGAFLTSRVEQMALARAAGEHMITSESGLAHVRADIGTVEARIDQTATRNSAEQASLQLALAAIVAVDPYEVATALQETQTQLETVYTITARLSRLNLSDFLR